MKLQGHTGSEHPLQRHLMACVSRQEDESVASGRLRTRTGAILAGIHHALGGLIFVLSSEKENLSKS